MKSMIAIVLILCLTVTGWRMLTAAEAQKQESLATQEPHRVQVTLLEADEHGQVTKTVHRETIWAMEDFWAEYQAYQLVDMNEKEVIFEKK